MSFLSLDENADLESLDSLISDALHAARINLGMEVAFVSEFKAGRRVFRYVDAVAGQAAVQPGASHPLEESYCQRIVDGRLPELIGDTAHYEEARRLAVTAQLSIGAYLGVPIRYGDGRLHGTLCCFSSRPDNTLNERDLHTVRFFAGFVGSVLDRRALKARAQEELATRLRKVLDGGRFQIVYQPIINVAQNRLVGHEALTRFQAEPVRTPDQWFNEAAEVDLQEELELAAIAKALEGLAHFPEDTYISLNISPDTLLKGSLERVLEGAPLERLMLEVTEHASVNDYAQVAAALAPLRRKGLRLAVDDAGAGFASFRHILKLEPDVIKLDRSLIESIDQGTGCRALAAALIRFAEETGSKVVAEGVETEAELAVLRDLKVNKAQGFLLGRPKPL